VTIKCIVNQALMSEEENTESTSILSKSSHDTEAGRGLEDNSLKFKK
jgi:hypothetical protein